MCFIQMSTSFASYPILNAETASCVIIWRRIFYIQMAKKKRKERKAVWDYSSCLNKVCITSTDMSDFTEIRLDCV